MLAALAVIISGLLGVHVGATWPWLAFWVRRRLHLGEPTMSRSPEERRLLILTWVMVGVMACAFVAAILLILTRFAVSDSNRELRDYQRCQAEYQTAFATAYQARADASIEVTKAMDDVVKAVADEDSTAFGAAVQHYLQVRADQTRERKDNPLPPLPATVCGPAPKES